MIKIVIWTEEIGQQVGHLSCPWPTQVQFLTPHMVSWVSPGVITDHRDRNKPCALQGMAQPLPQERKLLMKINIYLF